MGMTLTSPITVLGAGAWGTALAIHLAKGGWQVRLWEFNQTQAALLKANRCNERYLPGIAFPDSLSVIEDLADAISGVSTILIVVPSFAFAQTLTALKPLIHTNVKIAWATKGLDPKTHAPLSQIAHDLLGERALAVLSGPSFAAEVARGLPTAITVAANRADFSEELIHRFNHGAFRVYKNDDLIGVQLGGALKNVVAIATGASDGLGFGSNAKSALITRGLAEMIRLGLKMGAKQETFMGLSGLGDLVLTCTDNQSRNRRLGLMLAKGLSHEQAEKEIGQVTEGAHTVEQVKALSEKYAVDMPICDSVYQVLKGQVSLKEAVFRLIDRPTKSE